MPERSMNGRPIPADDRPMPAILAYLNLLSTNIPAEARIAGAGPGAMSELDRAAEPSRGAAVYGRVCAECHRRDGLGVRRNETLPAMGYAVPPPWGPGSFNDGAGPPDDHARQLRSRQHAERDILGRLDIEPRGRLGRGGLRAVATPTCC
jgi:cytochrome c